MKKIKVKQGTRAWEQLRETRIGSSEVFDIVRYYATETELQNCGLNAEMVMDEKPFVTAWALYHKILNDGIYQRDMLSPELAEYGHAAEIYGREVFQSGRQQKLKLGEVFIDERLIASLDISGISEETDERAFDYGNGRVMRGKKFVCEQKTMMPQVIKNGLPLKYVIQAQYQVMKSKSDFYILQIMVLENDTEYERGKIVQAAAQSKKKLREYLKDKINITYLYFANNKHLAALIQTCLKRFFTDVDNKTEPKAFIEHDKQRNIIESLRINSFYNKDMVIDYDLKPYILAKNAAKEADDHKKKVMQEIIDAAMAGNASRFISDGGYSGKFSSDGKFLISEPKGGDSVDAG